MHADSPLIHVFSFGEESWFYFRFFFSLPFLYYNMCMACHVMFATLRLFASFSGLVHGFALLSEPDSVSCQVFLW